MNIARKVSMMPQTYPTKAKWKQFRLIQLQSLKVLPLAKAKSKSNFRHSETKTPGMTKSPSPTIEVLKSPSALRYGKTILMGMSRFLATVTITSVPYTQKISQKKSAQSKKRPVFVLLRLRLFRATSVNRMAKMLLSAQCLVQKQNPTGKAAKTMDTILEVETQNFLTSNTF